MWVAQLLYLQLAPPVITLPVAGLRQRIIIDTLIDYGKNYNY